MKPADVFTWRASHELYESVSDPFYSTWIDATNGNEICDACNDDSTTTPAGNVVSVVANLDGSCPLN